MDESNMKNSTRRGGSLRSAIGKFSVALAFTSVIGGMAVYPAFADRGDWHGGGDRGGWHGGGDHGGWRGGDDRGEWHRGYGRHDWRGRPEYEPYPVYAPPTVYYPPQPSPGVSLFFPIWIH
jgi:hypothetical protein